MSHLVRLLVTIAGRLTLSSQVPLGRETLRYEGWVSVEDICSDIDMHMHEIAAGRMLGSSSVFSKEESSLICWTSWWIQTQA